MPAMDAMTNTLSKVQTIGGHLAVSEKASYNNVLYVTSYFKVVSQHQTD